MEELQNKQKCYLKNMEKEGLNFPFLYKNKDIIEDERKQANKNILSQELICQIVPL